MEARYKKACVGYARIREKILQDKINAGQQNPVVTRLDTWEYDRRDADGIINDPVRLQVLHDVVTISAHLPENELTNIGSDDLLARVKPLEYPGRVRGLGWGVTKTSLQTLSTMNELSKLKNDVSYLINEMKELKTKGYTPGAQSGGQKCLLFVRESWT
ncbi:uncharacterized protein LOC141675138 isoform X1 [Apium graveolens]|uniref:uncharacterized protein LOC141670625 isoform X1 n=1 Tax=Apium graveolens TaxID=4045 RepID=UPI003D7B9057